MVTPAHPRTAVLLVGTLVVGCSSDVIQVEVTLVEPCNQSPLSSMQWLRLTAEGRNLAADAFDQTVATVDRSTGPIEVPLVEDFRLIARGYYDQAALASTEPSGLGVSEPVDLTDATAPVSMRLPFAELNAFHRTGRSGGVGGSGRPADCTSMRAGRFGHTATLVGDRVLIVGGARLAPDRASLEYATDIELFDPRQGTFRVVGQLMNGETRIRHSATRVGEGRVLIAGGEGVVSGALTTLTSGLLLDASDPEDVRVVVRDLQMRTARTGHRSVRLHDGRVLLIGGRTLTPGASARDHVYLASVELFDPDQRVFLIPQDAVGNALSLRNARYGHSATIIGDGRAVFIAGGADDRGPILQPEVVAFDPSSGRFEATALTGAIGVGPLFHGAAFDPATGGVILAGGYGLIDDAEPMTGSPLDPRPELEVWVPDGADGPLRRGCGQSMRTARGHPTVTVTEGRVVVVGGWGNVGEPVADAEWAPLLGAGAGVECFQRPPTRAVLSTARTQHTATVLPSAEVLVLGGQTVDGEAPPSATASAEVFSPTRTPR